MKMTVTAKTQIVIKLDTARRKTKLDWTYGTHHESYIVYTECRHPSNRNQKSYQFLLTQQKKYILCNFKFFFFFNL